MGPRGLVDLCRVGGKLVPEAVETNALAPRDEPLGVRAAKGEMPEQGVRTRSSQGGMPGTGASITTSFSVFLG